MRIPLSLGLLVILFASPLHAVTGFLFGPDGAPLPNAAISAVRPAAISHYPSQPVTVLATGRTDSNGAFALDVSGRQVVDVQVRVEGFAPVDMILASDDRDVGILLSAAAMREGKVTAGGKPVAGAEIVASNRSSAVSVISDANGVFRLPDPTKWAEDITVTHADFAPYGGRRDRLEYALDPGGTMDGSVVDEAGHPVAGAEVTFRQGVSTKTRADGKFHFAHMPISMGALIASIPTARGVAFGFANPVVKLQPARTITGVVRNQAKQPVGGVVVYLGGDNIQDSTTTDVSGSFSFASVPRGPVSLATYDGGGYKASRSSLEAGDGDLRHDIELSPTWHYEGRVVAADGSPQGGAAIIAIFQSNQYEEPVPLGIVSIPDGRFHFDSGFTGSLASRLAALSPAIPPGKSERIVDTLKPIIISVPKSVPVTASVVDSDNHGVPGVEIRPFLTSLSLPGGGPPLLDAWRRTDENGRFTFPASVDSMVLELRKPGYDVMTMTVPGKGTPSLRVVMRTAPSLQGVILDAQNKPAPGVPVSVGSVTVTTGADGSFQFYGLPPGRVSLKYGTEKVVTMPLEVPSLGTNLSLPRLKNVRGQVVDADTGEPIEQFDIVESRKTVHSADGGFDATVWDDVFRLTIAAPGYRRRETSFSANPVVIRLEALPILSGTVLGITGAPAPGLTIGISPAGVKDAEMDGPKTDDKGAFEFAQLPPGAYDLKVEDKDGNYATLKSVDVAKTHEVTLQLRKPPRGVVFGTVSGIQSPSLVVEVRNGLWIKNVHPDPSGNYRAEVPPGYVILELQVNETGQSRNGSTAGVEVAAGTETRVDLAFGSTVKITGHVTDRSGTGLSCPLYFSGPSGVDVHSDEQGAYSADVEPGTYEVTISDGRTPHRMSQRTVVIKEAMTLDFRVEEHPLTIRVVDFDSGSPVGSASVRTTRPGENLTWTDAVTSGDGTVVVKVPDGMPMNVIVAKEGYSGTHQELSGDESTVDLRLRNKPSVIVHLVDARDSHALSGYVNARQTDGPNAFFAGPDDPNGVQLPLPPGTYRLSASADGYGSETVTVQVPSTDVRIPLPRGGGLVVHAPIRICGAPARLLLLNGEEYVPCWCNGIATIVIDCPQTVIDHITPGPYVLEIAPRGEKLRIPVTVVEGQVVAVTVP